MLSRFHLIPDPYGQTDGRTDKQTDRRTELLYQYCASVCWRAIKNEATFWLFFTKLGDEMTETSKGVNPLYILGAIRQTESTPPADHFWLRQPKLKRSDTFGVISGMLSQSAVYFTFFHHSFPRFYAVICFLFVLLSGVIFVITARRVCIARTMPSQDVCLFVNFVRPSHAGIVSKRLHIYSDFCLPSGSPTILVFPHQTGWQYSGGDLTGAWNAKVYEKITIFDQYMALSRKWRKIEP